MAMLNVDEFESHRSGAFHAVFVSTRRAKPTVTVERDIFKVATMGAMIHGTAKGRIPTMDHLFDIFHFGVSGMESIFYFFIMVCKNFLQDIHKQRCTRGYKRYKETSGLIEWKECQIFHSIFT